MGKKELSAAEKKALILAKIHQISERKKSKSTAAKSTKRNAEKKEETEAKTARIRKAPNGSNTMKARFSKGSLLIRIEDVPLGGAPVKQMWLVDENCQLLQKFIADDDAEDYYIRTVLFTKYDASDADNYLEVKVEERGEQGRRIKVAYPDTAVLMDAKARQAAIEEVQQPKMKKSKTQRSSKSG